MKKELITLNKKNCRSIEDSIKKQGINSGNSKSFSGETEDNKQTLSADVNNDIIYKTKKPKLFSEQWCKDKKVEIYKKGFPAIFEDMSKLRVSGYFATTFFREKPLSYYSLNGVSGVYMITNKITKKIYIGKSKNLKDRFYNYLFVNRLIENKSSRIHKALLKYGYSNFSVTILEFTGKASSDLLNARENFYIKVFKPQYNIARSCFNIDSERGGAWHRPIKIPIPTKVKNLLDRSLNPDITSWRLILFEVNIKKFSISLVAESAHSFIWANSKGWFDGIITKPEGFKVIKNKNKSSSKTRSGRRFEECIKGLINKPELFKLYPPQMRESINKGLKKTGSWNK